MTPPLPRARRRRSPAARPRSVARPAWLLPAPARLAAAWLVAAWLVVAPATGAVLAQASSPPPTSSPPTSSPPTSSPPSSASPSSGSPSTDGRTVTVVAAGDIACEPGAKPTARACQQQATADLVARIAPDAVLAIGDLQYPKGTLASFQQSYAASWGRFKSITYPVPGNHAYYSGGSGYYAYWGARAGEPGKGYYSFDLGAWHILALNSNCPAVGGCGPGSPEIRWIARDLAAHPSVCSLAFFHHPRFSSGPHGNDASLAPLWTALEKGGVDVVLNGHDHDYERFALQDASGRLDPAHGIREFVVGTGGAPQYVVLWRRAHSQALEVGTFGVLELRLHPGSYDWAFRPLPGSSFHDSGSTACHGPPG